jgi:hypothetical protein
MPRENLCALAAILFLLPFAANASTTGFEINGTCLPSPGDCPVGPGSAGALTSGESASGGETYELTLTDGDRYSVAWIYSNAFYSGVLIIDEPVVTYIGTSPSAGNDVIDFDMFQTFYSPGSAINWSGPYDESIPLYLSSGVGSGSSISGFAEFDGNPLPTFTQRELGYTLGERSAYLNGLTGNTLTAGYELTFDFGVGTVDGAFGDGLYPGTSPIPEPNEALPLAAGLALIGFIGYRSKKRKHAHSFSL